MHEQIHSQGLAPAEDVWDVVGGIIASDTAVTETAHLTASSPKKNVAAFDVRLDALITNWDKDYRYVIPPWDDTSINAAVDDLHNTYRARLKVVVVTGTMLGAKVLARRNAIGGTWWIVMATDDGGWVNNFSGTYATDRITGISSFFTDNIGDHIKAGAKRFHKDNGAGTKMNLAVIMADDDLLGGAGSAAHTEKLDQLLLLGTYVTGGDALNTTYIRVHATAASTTATFTVDGLPTGANTVYVLGDAATFLAHSVIEKKFRPLKSCRLGLVEHHMCLWTGKCRSHGPHMQRHYRKVATMVADILTGVTPQPPPAPSSKRDDLDDHDDNDLP